MDGSGVSPTISRMLAAEPRIAALKAPILVSRSRYLPGRTVV